MLSNAGLREATVTSVCGFQVRHEVQRLRAVRCRGPADKACEDLEQGLCSNPTQCVVGKNVSPAAVPQSGMQCQPRRLRIHCTFMEHLQPSSVFSGRGLTQTFNLFTLAFSPQRSGATSRNPEFLEKWLIPGWGRGTTGACGERGLETDADGSEGQGSLPDALPLSKAGTVRASE